MSPNNAAESLARMRRGVCLLALHELGDIDSANDVAQETIARLLRAEGDARTRNEPSRDETQLGAFARGIARHVILDVIRARQRTIATGAATLALVQSPRDDPLTALVSREQHDAVHEALGTLAPGDRDLLHMAFFDGATSEELAQRLHEPAARIRKRKARALERLRRAFFGAQRHTPALSPTSVNTSHKLSNVSGLG